MDNDSTPGALGLNNQLGHGAEAMKDHEKRELVDRLTSLAQEFADTQQLRARIASEVLPAIDAAVAAERERCAQVCDQKFDIRSRDGFPREASAARSLAKEIRGLTQL